jgi:hypothetical protein
VHGTHRLSDEVLEREAARYGRYLEALVSGVLPAPATEVSNV